MCGALLRKDRNNTFAEITSLWCWKVALKHKKDFPLSFLQFSISSFLHSFFLYSFIFSIIHSFIPSFLRLFIPSLLHSFISSILHSVIPSLLHSFISSFLQSFITSFLHWLVPAKEKGRKIKWSDWFNLNTTPNNDMESFFDVAEHLDKNPDVSVHGLLFYF